MIITTTSGNGNMFHGEKKFQSRWEIKLDKKWKSLSRKNKTVLTKSEQVSKF